MLLHDELNIVTLLNGVKTSKNIVKGDILIGEEPLIVIGVEAKIYTSYNLVSEWAEHMLLSDKNILYLYNIFTESYINITVSEYLKKPLIWREKHKLAIIPISFIKKPTKNDPYLIGMMINQCDSQIINKYINTLRKIDNKELSEIMDYKFIPDDYLYNDYDIRLDLLRGIVEDKIVKKPTKIREISYYTSKIPLFNDNISLEISDKNLLEQIKFLARSLAIKCYSKNNILYIDFNNKKNIFLCDFKLEQSKANTYMYIELYKNGLTFSASAIPVG